MSRCFPFPPPGYEKKAKLDEVELLNEEKLKEKKHKKKKDKEKSEGKEKRDKDRSDKKHREKRDKKEKRKDKKEKHREKKKDKEKDKDTTCIKRPPDGQHVCNGQERLQNSAQGRENESFKLVLELGKRIRDGNEGRESLAVENITNAHWKKDEEVGRHPPKDASNVVEFKEQKHNGIDWNNTIERGIRNEVRSSGNVVHDIVGQVQGKAGMSRPKEDIERKMEGKDKGKPEDRGDKRRKEKQKDKEKDKKSHRKDKKKDKEKSSKGKEKEKKNEQKKAGLDKVEDAKKSVNDMGSHHSKGCYINNALDGGGPKRKDIDTNGFLHDSEVRPSKIPRSTSHTLTENGRKMQLCQTSGIFTSDAQGAVNNFRADIKEHKLNGIVEAKRVDVVVEASRKAPHPDSKYLSQVLLVPKMVELSDFDDQNWLFRNQNSPFKQPEEGCSRANEDQRVWSEAIKIDSADIFALPYVIPY